MSSIGLCAFTEAGYLHSDLSSYRKWLVRTHRGYELVIVEAFGVARVLIPL